MKSINRVDEEVRQAKLAKRREYYRKNRKHIRERDNARLQINIAIHTELALMFKLMKSYSLNYSSDEYNAFKLRLWPEVIKSVFDGLSDNIQVRNHINTTALSEIVSLLK